MDERRLLERTAALGIQYVESVPGRAAAPAATIDELRATLDLPLAEEPTDGLEVIEALARTSIRAWLRWEVGATTVS